MSTSPPLPDRLKLAARRFLAAFITLGLRLRSRPLPLGGTSLWLVVAPHPDDETLGCGSLIYARRQAGLPLHVLFLTDGAASHPGHPQFSPEQIAALRCAESTHALHELGVDTDALHFINAPDGTLAHLGPDAAAELIAQLSLKLTSLAPSFVCLPCRDDGSSEHDAAFGLIRRALAASELRPRLLEYPIWSRWSPVRFAARLLHRSTIWRVNVRIAAAHKARALTVFNSQSDPLPPWIQSVLPPGFTAFFASGEEFFFEQ